MTLARRISLARTLTMVQLVLSGLIALVILAVGGFMVYGAGIPDVANGDIGVPVVVVTVLVCLILALIVVAFPAVVLIALKKRTENWATAAFVSLVLQIVGGGGLLSIFPIITLVLFLDKEASAYIGMK